MHPPLLFGWLNTPAFGRTNTRTSWYARSEAQTCQDSGLDVGGSFGDTEDVIPGYL